MQCPLSIHGILTVMGILR